MFCYLVCRTNGLDRVLLLGCFNATVGGFVGCATVSLCLCPLSLCFSSLSVKLCSAPPHSAVCSPRYISRCQSTIPGSGAAAAPRRAWPDRGEPQPVGPSPAIDQLYSDATNTLVFFSDSLLLGL